MNTNKSKSKQIPQEPDIVGALMKVGIRLESLSNEQDERIFLTTSRCVGFIEDALQGTYEIDFGDIIRELKWSAPGFVEDIRKTCEALLQIAHEIDKKIEAGEPPIKSHLKILRSSLQQLADDFSFVANKLRKGR